MGEGEVCRFNDKEMRVSGLFSPGSSTMSQIAGSLSLLRLTNIPLYVQAYLILLHFSLFHFTDNDYFTNGRFVAALHRASQLVLFSNMLRGCLSIL